MTRLLIQRRPPLYRLTQSSELIIAIDILSVSWKCLREVTKAEEEAPGQTEGIRPLRRRRGIQCRPETIESGQKNDNSKPRPSSSLPNCGLRMGPRHQITLPPINVNNGREGSYL